MGRGELRCPSQPLTAHGFSFGLREAPRPRHRRCQVVRVACLGYLAFAAAEVNDRRDLQRWAVKATWLVDEAHVHEAAGSEVAYTAGALAHHQLGDHTEAAGQLERVRRVRRYLRAAPWVDVDVALRCADISLDLGDPAGALEFAQVAGDGLQGYPDAGTLPERLRRLEERIRRGQDYGLTAAELRPSCESSASWRHISRSRRSPLGCSSHARPSRPTSRRSTTSSASQAGPKRSRPSRSSASDPQTPRPRNPRRRTSTETANPRHAGPGWLAHDCVPGDLSRTQARGPVGGQSDVACGRRQVGRPPDQAIGVLSVGLGFFGVLGDESREVFRGDPEDEVGDLR